jgi:CRP-like cAMP-binding protein
LIQYTHKDIIKKNSFFFGKSFEFAINILSIQNEITIPPDDILYKKGDPAEEVYIIYSGSIKLLSEDWIPYVKYGTGSYFGEIEVIFKEERQNAAYAEIETVVGVVMVNSLIHLLERTVR